MPNPLDLLMTILAKVCRSLLADLSAWFRACLLPCLRAPCLLACMPNGLLVRLLARLPSCTRYPLACLLRCLLAHVLLARACLLARLPACPFACLPLPCSPALSSP